MNFSFPGLTPFSEDLGMALSKPYLERARLLIEHAIRVADRAGAKLAGESCAASGNFVPIALCQLTGAHSIEDALIVVVVRHRFLLSTFCVPSPNTLE
jgi:hypothetical protein